MLNYKKCKIFGLQSKKQFMQLFSIENKSKLKFDYIMSKTTPFINIKDGKERLAEAPSEEIKTIQRKILRKLAVIEVPANIFSGIKGKSYIDNAKLHKGKDKYMYKIDISKFFPHIKRETVYRFYKNKLHVSPDVAEILTNFSITDLDNKSINSRYMKEVDEYIIRKNITCRSHLSTGSPLSSILSYFVNVDMFNQIQYYCDKKNIFMTVYSDDITFTSFNVFSAKIRNDIIDIIESFDYKVSKKKTIYSKKNNVRLVTGVIIDGNGKLQVPNKLVKKLHNNIKYFKLKKYDVINKIQGCTYAANSINGKFEGLKRQLNGMRKQNIKD